MSLEFVGKLQDIRKDGGAMMTRIGMTVAMFGVMVSSAVCVAQAPAAAPEQLAVHASGRVRRQAQTALALQPMGGHSITKAELRHAPSAAAAAQPEGGPQRRPESVWPTPVGERLR